MNDQDVKQMSEHLKFIHDVLKEMRTELDHINTKLSILIKEK